MSDTVLVLGPVTFKDFEIPQMINFGGRQRLVVHNLPDGSRVIDALGPDDSDIEFRGTLAGPDAIDRARLIDTLRASGSPIALTWSSIYRRVIVKVFYASFESRFWIPYRICCTVVAAASSTGPSSYNALTELISADLQVLGTLGAVDGTDWTAGQLALIQPDALVLGSPAYTSSVSAVAAIIAGISKNLVQTDHRFEEEASQQMLDIRSASGRLDSAMQTNMTVWQTVMAQGYWSRISGNLANASS